MRMTTGTPNCPPDMCRYSVAALFTIWSSASRLKLHRHDLDDGPHAAQRRADAGADEAVLGQRRVADALSPNSASRPLLTA
jgi:hypothetical protein